MRPMLRANLVGGLVAIAIGALAFLETSRYTIGTARQMGPGFFPTVLAGLMVALGIAILVINRRNVEDGPILRPAFRGLVFVMASILAFALLIDRMGLAPAVLATVVVSAAADPRPNVLSIALLSVGIATLSVVLFILLLGLNMAVVRW